ncbi:MAG: Ni/Fe hydrogenase subunit alpha [bacterium]
MSHNLPINIDINYLARVEGEASLSIDLDKELGIKLKVFEPPRFFEGFLVGRKYDEVGDIVSRICGICPVSHMTTAIQAVEKAMDIKVSEQTIVLRKIMSISQIVASHLIHLYMLAMPDYYGYSGIPAMLSNFNEEVGRILKIKEVINKLTGLIGGRALHPVTSLPGGFTSTPSDKDIKAFLKLLNGIKQDAVEVVKDIFRFKVPDFHSDSEYAALDSDDEEYAINGGRLVSSQGLNIKIEDYREYFKESQVKYAFTKPSIIKRYSSFMVGALARLNIKFDKLLNETKAIAQETGFSLPNDNPFYNNLAQSLEVVDGIERCIRLIESHSFKDEEFHVEINEGEGSSMTEAPRGLLYHRYRIDQKGVVEEADIVTPTSHNFLNIEKDLKNLIKENIHQQKADLILLSEQLVRAYDPCFSCSVH